MHDKIFYNYGNKTQLNYKLIYNWKWLKNNKKKKKIEEKRYHVCDLFIYFIISISQ